MFAHSRSDSLLVLLCGIQISLLIWVAFAFSSLPWPALVCVGGVLIFLTCTNYQCVAHNFIHNPFFHSKVANQWFAVMNSLALGMPQNLYYYHHMNHHKYNNDDMDLQSRETKDRSSIFRFSSKRGKAENIFPYALLGGWCRFEPWR